MKKILFVCIAFLSGFVSAAAYPAQGEYWEVTSKMEMPGMPMAMPAQTSKVCIPQGGEKDPRRMQKKDSNCEITDVKTSGNKVSWKGKCVSNGETMNQVGEATHERDSFHSTMHMTATGKRPMEMTATSSGKRIGGSCDSEEMAKKAQAQAQAMEKDTKGMMDKLCDTSNFNAYKWVSSANLFIAPQPTCPGKKEALCQVVRNDVPHDVQAFEALVQQEQIQGMPSTAKACNVNIESMKNALCKDKARSGPLSFLDKNCPAEAKAYRELARKREECQGRGYTSGEKMKACMGGAMPEEDADSGSAGVDAMKAKPNQQQEDEGRGQKETGKPAKENNPASEILDGAKKLKGLFNF